MRNMEKSLNLSISQRLLVYASKFGGVTLKNDNSIVTSGFISGIDKKGLIFNSISGTNEHEICQYITENKPEFIGSWLDNETGKIYIDIVQIFDNLQDCLIFAAKNNQLAIYDLNNQKEIRL